MPSFALVTEGITDQAVIENLLHARYGDLQVNPLQPLAAEGKQASEGGWYRVFEYLASSKIQKALQVNDYLIVQVDTDCSEDNAYNVSQGVVEGAESRELTVDELRSAVKARLAAIIEANHEATATIILERTLFAIAVHSLECWLLVKVAAKKEKGRTKNCHHHLERGLKRNMPKDHRTYDDLTRDWRKPKHLKEAANQNRSLALFLAELPLP